MDLRSSLLDYTYTNLYPQEERLERLDVSVSQQRPYITVPIYRSNSRRLTVTVQYKSTVDDSPSTVSVSQNAHI